MIGLSIKVSKTLQFVTLQYELKGEKLMEIILISSMVGNCVGGVCSS